MSLESTVGYNVVLEYTRGNDKGIREVKSFESVDSFKQWYSPKIARNEKVLKQGISLDEAYGLEDEVSLERYHDAAQKKSWITFFGYSLYLRSDVWVRETDRIKEISRERYERNKKKAQEAIK